MVPAFSKAWFATWCCASPLTDQAKSPPKQLRKKPSNPEASVSLLPPSMEEEEEEQNKEDKQASNQPSKQRSSEVEEEEQKEEEPSNQASKQASKHDVVEARS